MLSFLVRSVAACTAAMVFVAATTGITLAELTDTEQPPERPKIVVTDRARDSRQGDARQRPQRFAVGRAQARLGHL